MSLHPLLLQIVASNDRNRRVQLATRLQAEIEADKRAKTVAVAQFARIADRHEVLLTSLIDMGIENLSELGGRDIALEDLILDDDPKTTGDNTTAPQGAEGQER